MDVDEALEGSDEDEDEFEQSSDVQEGKTLFIRNVSFDTTDEDLAKLFSAYGEVALCKIVRDFDTGRSRGTAFVKFAERDHAAAALDRGGRSLGALAAGLWAGAAARTRARGRHAHAKNNECYYALVADNVSSNF